MILAYDKYIGAIKYVSQKETINVSIDLSKICLRSALQSLSTREPPSFIQNHLATGTAVFLCQLAFSHSETQTTSEHCHRTSLPFLLWILKCPFVSLYRSRIWPGTTPRLTFFCNPVSHHVSYPLIRPGVWDKWNPTPIWQNTPWGLHENKSTTCVCAYVYVYACWGCSSLLVNSSERNERLLCGKSCSWR